MAQAEIVREDFAHHNPLKFKSHPRDKRLYWANRVWRGERRGWGQLTPVRSTDPDYPDLKKHLSEIPPDIDIAGDGLIRRGDLVLCTKPLEDVEKSNRRRHYLANKKLDMLKKGTYNPIAEELSKLRNESGSEYLTADRPEFSHGRTGEPQVIRSGKGGK